MNCDSEPLQLQQHHNIHVSAHWLASVLHVLSVLRPTAVMALLALINYIFGTRLGDVLRVITHSIFA